MTNQELLALVKKNPVSVGCGLLALALGVGFYFRSDQIPAVTAQLDQVSAEGRRLTANIRNAAQLAEQIAVLEEAGRKIAPRLVSAPELAKNLQYFYKLEADTGTKLLDLRQLPPAVAVSTKAPPAAYAGVGFALSVEGEYPALIEFLRRLENGTHYCRVLNAAVTTTSGEVDRNGPLKLTLTLELLGQP